MGAQVYGLGADEPTCTPMATPLVYSACMVEHWYTIVTIPSTLDDFQQALTAQQSILILLHYSTVLQPSGGHDLCSDIHECEVSQFT